MLEKNKNHINGFGLNKTILPVILLAIPLSAYAFSVSEFFGYITNATVTNKVDNIHEENLQSLKVFEPNKALAQSANDVVPEKKDLVKDTSTSFEVNNDFTDALDSGSSEGIADNAVYTVQKGDSIYSIASYFGVSVQTIMTFNHKEVKTVHVGDVLEVPSVSGVLYTIQKGDTLTSLAKKYNVDQDDVSLYNGLLSSDTLAIGDEVFLPGAKDIAADTSKKSGSKSGSKNISIKVPSAGTLVNKSGTWAKGDTAHLNTVADVNKYSTLPKYPGYYIFPAPGAVRTQKMHGHNGVDLASKLGSPILAAADGVVTTAKTGGYNFGYGNYIIIKHSNGSETLYGHLLQVKVAVGQSVSQGQIIGLLGSSGNSTGPHVHFEVRGAYNPFAW